MSRLVSSDQRLLHASHRSPSRLDVRSGGRLVRCRAMSAQTRLERALAEGRFAVTSELGPPKHAGPEAVAEKARILGPACDGVNITDNQAGQSRMSPLAAGRIALEAGAEPVMQITVRDRNRMALTSDLLGAS